MKKVCVLIVFAAGLLAAGDNNPWIGTWKMDASKSQLTGTTIKYEDAGSGKVRYSTGDRSYWFTTDGEEHPGLFGSDVSVKKVDDNTWERTARAKGKVLVVSTQKLSDGGKTMTVESKGTSPDGTSFDDTAVYERVGDGSGFMGEWKTKEVKDSTPSVIVFEENGADGLSFDIPAMKAKCPLKFDGKEYTATGPTIPEKLTLSATRTGDKSFDLVEKVGGSPVWKGTYTISDDGKTLTSTGTSSGANEPTTEVFEKQ